jgi:hypothetical protein
MAGMAVPDKCPLPRNKIAQKGLALQLETSITASKRGLFRSPDHALPAKHVSFGDSSISCRKINLEKLSQLRANGYNFVQIRIHARPVASCKLMGYRS